MTLRCAACERENPDDARFCSACGCALAAACPSCGQTVPAGSRFCGFCGALVETAAEPGGGRPGLLSASGERRQVTVMFADVSGYTALHERLDPEEVDLLLSEIKRAAERIVARHGGIVNQFIGDEVLAVFGIPRAEEDDPRRAVLAALELHRTVEELGAAYEARAGAPIAIHTGINCGLVVAQYRNDREGLYRLMGDAVNTAARLRSAAAAGEVLVGPAVQPLVAPYLRLEPCEPLSLKGKLRPIQPWRVLGPTRVTSRFEASRRRGLIEYVGRGAELTVLQDNLAAALAGRGRIVTLEGEPGIGKTRLLYEFISRIDRKQVIVSQGHCQAYGSEIPYFPFLDALRRGLGIDLDGDAATARAKAVSTLSALDPALEPLLPFYLHLLSIPGPYSLPAHLKGEALRQAMEEALASLIASATRTRPAVLVLESWHWSDAASRSALRHLAPLVRASRLLLIVSWRPLYGLDLEDLGAQARIRLAALDRTETEALVRAITGATQLPVGTGAWIHENTDGNPLFVEEACRALLEEGVILVDEAGRLVSRRPLDQLDLPDSVQAVIRARLDRLDSDAREVVALASVIGRSFDERLLAELYRAQRPLAGILAELEGQEIIRRLRSLPEPEFAFRHALTREVAYDTLLNQQRGVLHKAVGEAIERLHGRRLAEQASILAYHFARSTCPERSVPYAFQAGEQAAGLYASAEARSYLESALDIAGSLPAGPEATCWKIDAILRLAALGAAPHEAWREGLRLEEARETAQRLGDRRRLAQALYWLGRHHYLGSELERAVAYAEESLKIADELGEPALAAPPVNLMGRALWQLGELERSALMTGRSIEQMRLLGNRAEEATAAGFLSALLAYLGRFERALELSEHSLALAGELGNPMAEAAAYHYRGIIRDQRGQWEAAIADYRMAQNTARRAGDLFRIYLARFMEGRALLMTGDIESARSAIEAALRLAERIGTSFLLGQAKGFLAACSLAAGAPAEARGQCVEALELARQAGDRFTRGLVLRVLGEVRAAECSEPAQPLLEEAVAIHETIGARPELARSCAALATILHRVDACEEAGRWAARAAGLFGELGMDWDMAHTLGAFDPKRMASA
ncbi:AAA family ATPase [Geminicoccaceae bacterium 1502E]|nr:AAA family ATPase [Geminicoccaceae bacterium 1502E]